MKTYVTPLDGAVVFDVESLNGMNIHTPYDGRVVGSILAVIAARLGPADVVYECEFDCTLSMEILDGTVTRVVAIRTPTVKR